MPGHIKYAGAWKGIARPFVRNLGAWKGALNVWVKQGGVWKRVWHLDMFTGGNASAAAIPPAGAVASVTFNTNGTVSVVQGGSCDRSWYPTVVSGIGNSFWIRATLISGTTPSGPAVGVWHQLSAARQWSLSSFGGTVSCTIQIDIATAASASNIASSAQVQLSATVF